MGGTTPRGDAEVAKIKIKELMPYDKVCFTCPLPTCVLETRGEHGCPRNVAMYEYRRKEKRYENQLRVVTEQPVLQEG